MTRWSLFIQTLYSCYTTSWDSTTHRVSQATFDAALAKFGALGLTELTSLMGCYALLAFNVNAFGVELPAERTEEALPI